MKRKAILRQLLLHKLELVRFAKSRILHSTIRRNPSGKYFVSILAEERVQALPKTGSSVGVDVGIKDFTVLSIGEVFENPKWFRKLEKKLAAAQRVLSRRKEMALKRKCSLEEAKNYQKQKRKVARIHEKITHARTDYLQKMSTHIIKSHDVIGMEDLII